MASGKHYLKTFSYTAIFLAFYVGSSIAYRSGHFSRVLAEEGTNSDKNDDEPKPWWIYVVIPLVSSVVGWGTNVIALQMTFYPIEYFPGWMKWSQIPGQPCGWTILGGWQGIIPSKASKMAEIVSTLMITELIDVPEVFSRLEPERMAAALEVGFRESMAALMDQVGTTHFSGTWLATPLEIQHELQQMALTLSTDFTAGLISLMKKRILDVLDIVGMNSRLANENKGKIVTMFQKVGKKEFIFIEHSGAYFGFLFGLMQALVYAFYDAWWILPLAGFVVGYMTNYLALLLIFKPTTPKQLGPYTLHGAFLKRQSEVSAQFSDLMVELFMNAENMWEEMLHGDRHEEFDKLFNEYSHKFVSETLGFSKSFLALCMGENRIQEVSATIAAGLRREFPRVIKHGYNYTDVALNLQKTLEFSLKELPPEKFERVLHPAFEEDELKLILVGGALGIAAGFIQEFLVFANI